MLAIMRGALRSNTVQVNGILAAIWAALGSSETVTSNPEYTAIFGGIAAIVNIFLRFKTKTPLAER